MGKKSALSSALLSVMAERERQVCDLARDPAHDVSVYGAADAGSDLVRAAAGYALMAARDGVWARRVYPLGWGALPAVGHREALVRSAALIVADIERIDHAAAAAQPEGAGDA